MNPKKGTTMEPMGRTGLGLGVTGWDFRVWPPGVELYWALAASTL